MIADIFKGWRMDGDGVGENYCKLVVRLGYTGIHPGYGAVILRVDK